MEQKLLVVNTGSTSKKYGFYAGGREEWQAVYESDGTRVMVRIKSKISKEVSTRELSSLDQATADVVKSLLESGLISTLDEIEGVGIRIVAPGVYFQKHRIITAEYMGMLSRAHHQAPLHVGPALAEIKNFKKHFEKLPVVGVSDSAFHASLPELSYRYGIDRTDADKYGLRKFGYHGISMQSIVSQVEKVLGYVPEKMIVCHLGGGASVTAIKNGKSYETSMGLTPLEGLLMATRPGDIDPGVLVQLTKYKHYSNEDLENYLNYRCGLKGVMAGETGDMKTLLEKVSRGDKAALLAVEMYVHRVKKYVGGYAAILEGLDVLVFSATIGERSAYIREKICEGLRVFGINIDMRKNDKKIREFSLINSPTSQVQIAVVPTDEMIEIVKQVNNVFKSERRN